jgi:hypothetical protein
MQLNPSNGPSQDPLLVD